MPAPITTHVLDTAHGRPAAGIDVVLFRVTGTLRERLGQARTDADGRVMQGLLPESEFVPGVYEIRFDVEPYFAAGDSPCFYPEVAITFRVVSGQPHYHVPLLLSPFGFTTYRGS